MEVTHLESEPWCTPEEFARFLEEHEDEPNRYELLNGRIVVNPPPGYDHGRHSSRLVTCIQNFMSPNDLGDVLIEVETLLPSRDWVRPDVAVVLGAKAVKHRSKGDDVLRDAPDLVVEVLSKSTASRDRGEKKAIYERNGIHEYWLVDSVARSITRFVLGEVGYGAPMVFGPETYFASEVLAGLRFKVADVLPPP